MNARINQLVKSLLQKDSIDECSIQELQQYADQHPYFGAAQLLLTKKMKAENSVEYNDQLQKTYLFFHNPLWVEALLNETGTAKIAIPEQSILTAPVLEEAFITEQIKGTAPTVVEEIEPFVTNNLITEESQPKEVFSMPVTTTSEPTEVILPIAELAKATEEHPVNIPAFKIEPIDPAKAQLTFEPFYTVDYFASQGIKFKEDDKPKDRFGQNLKSFTDWLKIMKRLPATEIAKTTNAGIEEKVEQMAEHSLHSKEIVTEAMAEVWEKQGNMTKAIDIYSKLSLLEPHKSAYFASKIEDLK